MITLTFTRIRLSSGVVLTPTPFTLYYKEINDTSWTLIGSNIYVDINGYILASPPPQITVPGAGYYVLRAINDFCGIDYEQAFIVNEAGLYEWVEDDNYCEQGQPINLVDSISGFADPSLAGYDSVSGRVYIVDASAITQGSNIYHFDPDTIVSSFDVVPVGALNVAAFGTVFDELARKIYITGPDTGGLIIYNIATNSSSTLAFGTNGLYGRLVLEKNEDRLVCVDQVSQLVTVIDTTTETIVANTPYSSIPSYTQRFAGAPVVRRINGEWWVMNSQSASLGVPASSIARYNDSFSVLIGTISLPGQLTWDNSAYWRSATLLGSVLFVYDMGSNQLLTVDTNTLTVSSIYTFTNREGKSNSSLSVFKDAVSEELFISGDWRNTASDVSPISISYKLDNTNYLPDTVYPNLTIGSRLTRVGSSDILIGTYAGVLVYPSNPMGAATDGEINILSKSGVGNNTGTKIVLTLQEVNTVTDQPTGNTKPNVIGEPDYIAPYEDFINCPVSYTMLCPDTTFTIVLGVAEYEYSLAPSTYTNPAINNVLLQQIDTVTLAVLASYTVPLNAYQHGYITKIGSNANRIDLLFKDASNNTLSTCSNLFTIP